MSMNYEACLLGLAKMEIEKMNKSEFDETLSSLFLELTIATALAEAYEKTFNSVYWHDARASTRKRVKSTLNEIAFKVVDHVESAIKLFNEYCDEQDSLNLPMNETKFNTLAKCKYRLEQFYKQINRSFMYYETQHLQLKLF